MLLKENKVNEFLDCLASSSPSPGGGSASALIGSIASALIHMVAMLTTGREKYKDIEDLVSRIIEKSEEYKEKFTSLIDEDVCAFNCVSSVFSMPKKTEEEKIIRNEAMQEALKKAIVPPAEMIKVGADTLKLLSECVEKLNRNALTDLGVAAIALNAAIKGAWLNVLINLKGIHDTEFTSKFLPLEKEVGKCEKMAKFIYHCVEEKL